MAVNVSPWASTGNRGYLDIKTLDPQQLFNAHKARVTADGGTIMNEASLLDEIKFLVNNGMWKYVTFYASPEWGLKFDTDGTSVLKMYGLGPTDFYSYDVGRDIKRPVTVNTSVTPPKLMIWVWTGGSLMRAEKLVTAQYSADAPFLHSCIMDDTESSDEGGIAIVACRTGHVNSLVGMGVARSTKNNLDNAFDHGAAIVYPATTTGSYIGFKKTPYVPNVKNAILLDPARGTMASYAEGELVATTTSPSGVLVDSSAEPMQMNIGPSNNLVSSWNSNFICRGGVTRLRCLSFATPAQAVLISKRG
ncbi:Uncharacterised protein [Serratia marcescens]|uniref:hypothetical protein n=1 Tax=Serratia marcescens TaxID=615 RepID=UPI00074537CA|nr:hypothetical protein [Serratia marcescens]CUZ13920.1 Uncharacterised protein [Serratia marcescens]CVD96159.1 Uncharacterised protein [Serratia marcescens]